MKRGMNESDLDENIKRVYAQMQLVDPTSDTYHKLLQRLKTLTDLQLNEKPKKVSRDVLWAIAGNIGGILLIIAYEQKHIFTSSRSFNHLPKIGR